MYRAHSYLLMALLIGLAIHGAAMFFTLESTYDALIHLFFADHYAENWFEHWNESWYTGFSVHGYPPLVHQVMALLSLAGGLKFGLYAVALIAVVLFITGLYRFALLLVGKREVAGTVALVGVFSSAFAETLHLFGQLPSIIGLSLLMHALPEIYQYIATGRRRYLGTSLSLIAVTVASHHVTPIFGMIFFIFPVIGMVLMDRAGAMRGEVSKVRFADFYKAFRSLFTRIVLFGSGSLILMITTILPYWINSKANPITQVPIPHGSRDNFLEVTSSGLVFFLIPWGIMLLVMPYFFYRFYSRRFLFFGLSFTLLAVLGTGGTTPIPRAILGDTAFDILTLDRFTLWASIMALPIFGELIHRLFAGDLKNKLSARFGLLAHNIAVGTLLACIALAFGFTMSLGYFRPAQPDKIDILPIVNFLNQDEHYKWRYLPLGFGDQMAWLSANTRALTVDGNYHSARRLPELTTRAVERLENSKYRGVEGLGSLQQFLAVPEKYHLKYVFSNDKFYDPLLYFSGWEKLQRLENGILVWERANIPPLPTVLYKGSVNKILAAWWGTLPILALLAAFFFNLQWSWFLAVRKGLSAKPAYMEIGRSQSSLRPLLGYVLLFWMLSLVLIVLFNTYQARYLIRPQEDPEKVLLAYYDAIDFKNFETAHQYIDPAAGVDLDAYLLQIAITDGLMSSYAKLESFQLDSLDISGDRAKAAIRMNWVTPLKRITENKTWYLRREEGKWYLLPEPADPDRPADQLVSVVEPRFYNQGRRSVTAEGTDHRDILSQPRLRVNQARLIQNAGSYYVVGEVENIDQVPADVKLKANLYDAENQILASYNAQFRMKHKLMPGESTPFLVVFETTAWTEEGSRSPATFDPEQQTSWQPSTIPGNFDIQVSANISGKDLYRGLALQEFGQEGNSLQGNLYNWGSREVTIPQLLYAYYDDDGKLLWVENQFLQESVRVQRQSTFRFTPVSVKDIEVLDEGTDRCFVNGLPNPDASHPPARNLYPIHQGELAYINVTLNSYVAGSN